MFTQLGDHSSRLGLLNDVFLRFAKRVLKVFSVSPT